MNYDYLGLVSTTYQDVSPHTKLATRNACIRFLSMLSDRVTHKPSFKFDSMTVRKNHKTRLILNKEKAMEEIGKIGRGREEIRYVIKFHECCISALPSLPKMAIFKTHPKECRVCGWECSCDRKVRY